MLARPLARAISAFGVGICVQGAVAIVAMASRLDLKAVAAARGAKRAGRAEPAAAIRATGYVPSAISPLGERTRLAFVIDVGALGFERIHVSGGRRGLEIGLAPGDLVTLVGTVVGPAAR